MSSVHRTRPSPAATARSPAIVKVPSELLLQLEHAQRQGLAGGGDREAQLRTLVLESRRNRNPRQPGGGELDLPQAYRVHGGTEPLIRGIQDLRQQHDAGYHGGTGEVTREHGM